MQQVEVRKRLTNKYNPGWSHMDRWEWLCSLKLTMPKWVDTGNDYDDLGTYVQYTRIPAGMDWREVARALAQTLSGSGCRHEYDCCGCRSTWATVKFAGHRRLRVVVRVGANY